VSRETAKPLYLALPGEVTSILSEGGQLLASMNGGSRQLTAPLLCKNSVQIPQQTVEAMVRQAVAVQSMEAHSGADICLQPEEDPTPERVDVLKGGCDPVGSLCWSRLLVGPVDLWREEPTLEQAPGRTCGPVERGACAGAGSWQDLWTCGERSPPWTRLLVGPVALKSVPEGLHPMEGTHTAAIREELQPMGRTRAGEVHGGLCPVGRTPRWSRGRV